MALFRRIPRQIARHLFRYLSLTLLVALGSLALITLNLITDTLQFSFDRLGETGQVEQARAWLLTDPVNPDSLGRQFGVEIEGRRSIDLDWQDTGTLRVFDRSERVDRPVILEGRDVASDSEILLNPAFATAQSLAIGDTLVMSGFSYRVCGLFSLPDYIYPTRLESDMLTDPNQFGIAVLTKRAMTSLIKTVDLDEHTLDQSYGIRYQAGQQSIKDRLKERYGLGRWLEYKDNARINMVKGEIAGLREMSSSLPVAIFLINCALLASILWRMIRLEFPIIGTLRALGLGRNDLLRHYLVLPLIIAVFGSTLGSLGGLALSRPALVYYTTFFNLPLDQTRIDPVLMAASILLPILLMLVTAGLVILRAIRLPPQALIRGFKRRPKAMRLEKLIQFRKVRFETKFRIRQMIRSSGKLFAAIIGIAFATMLLQTGFLVDSSYDVLMGDGIRSIFRYEHNYVFKTLQLDDTYGGEPYQMASAMAIGNREPFMIQGLSPDGTLIQLAGPDGLPIEVQSAVITRVMADKMDLAAGDTLAFYDDLDGQAYFLRVGAVAEVYTQSAVYLPLAQFNDLFDLPEDSFRGIYSLDALDIDADDLVTDEQMNDLLKSFEAYAGVMKTSLVGMGVVSSVMALMILYILIALLIEENSRSIALLKILGYDTREIRRLVLRTFDWPVVVGYAIGIPLLFQFYGRLIESSLAEIDMTMPLLLSPRYIALGFVIIYATYLITRTLSGRKIFQISMSDALKSMQE